jgi:hypothetical protein
MICRFAFNVVRILTVPPLGADGLMLMIILVRVDSVKYRDIVDNAYLGRLFKLPYCGRIRNIGLALL